MLFAPLERTQPVIPVADPGAERIPIRAGTMVVKSGHPRTIEKIELVETYMTSILLPSSAGFTLLTKSATIGLNHLPTAPNHPNPNTAPITIAAAGLTPNHAVSAYVTAATTTHHGSAAKLFPLLLSGVKYPISHSLYTAVNTNPTAVALIPLSILNTIGFVLSTRHRLCTPTLSTIPGAKIPKPPRKAPAMDGVLVGASVSAPR
jgi:hypothetical protein